MNSKMITGLVLAALALTANNAAAEQEIYFAQEATLTCSTSAICGDYSAMHPLTVKAEGDERRLYWHNNSPSGIDAGINKAHTIGGACQAGSPRSHLTTEWELFDGGKPSKATVTHCDGVTQSEYTITVNHETFRDLVIDNYIDEGQCINPRSGSDWDENCNRRF